MRTKYPMTIKQAKLKAKEILGRLPHYGCEVCVMSWQADEWIKSELPSTYGKTFLMHVKHNLYLVNQAGSYYLTDYAHADF